MLDLDHEPIVSETLSGPFASMTIAKLLRRHGVLMKGAPLPAAVAAGRQMQCFRNAWDLSLSMKWEYWEDWGWDRTVGAIPFHHAWCVDPTVRSVVDPTWAHPEDCVYLGIHIPTGILSEALNETGTFGVLDTRWGKPAGAVVRYLHGL